MDLWQLIRSDYANIKELCRETLGAVGGEVKSRARLFDELERELAGHLEVKSIVLYPVLARDPRTRPYLDELEEEQDEIRSRLGQLTGPRNRDSRNWTLDFKQFVGIVEHHFNLEENGVLVVARSTIGSDEKEDLRRAYQRERIAQLQARRWHVPKALVPARYGVSTGVAIGVITGLAGLAIGAALLSRHSGIRTGSRRLSGGFTMTNRHPRTLRRTDMQVSEMIATHPHVKGNTNDALIRCIEECYSCAQTCTSCADACLGESMVQQLTQCIRLNLDCADVCAATGSVATRRTGSNEEVIQRMLEACATACRLCGEECEKHAGMHEHCRICAEACRRCERACREALQSMR